MIRFFSFYRNTCHVYKQKKQRGVDEIKRYVDIFDCLYTYIVVHILIRILCLVLFVYPNRIPNIFASYRITIPGYHKIYN